MTKGGVLPPQAMGVSDYTPTTPTTHRGCFPSLWFSVSSFQVKLFSVVLFYIIYLLLYPIPSHWDDTGSLRETPYTQIGGRALSPIRRDQVQGRRLRRQVADAYKQACARLPLTPQGVFVGLFVCLPPSGSDPSAIGFARYVPRANVSETGVVPSTEGHTCGTLNGWCGLETPPDGWDGLDNSYPSPLWGGVAKLGVRRRGGKGSGFVAD